MILPVEVRERLQIEHGIYVIEACNKCGSLIGPVRWTRAGEPGTWCSAICRDGVEAVAAREHRQSGRPRKYESNADRQRAYRRSRLRPLRNTLAAV